MFDPRMWHIIKCVWFGPYEPDTPATPAKRRFWWRVWSVAYILMLVPWAALMIPLLLFAALVWICEHIEEALDGAVGTLMDMVHPKRFGLWRKHCYEQREYIKESA